MSLLTRLAEVNDNDTNSCLSSLASTFGVVILPSSAQVNNIDTYLATTLSELAVRARFSLPEFVRCIRGQTDADGRPNKALYEVPIQHDNSRRRSYELWNRIVREGVRPKWTQSKPQTQQYRPKNHKSADAHAAAVTIEFSLVGPGTIPYTGSVVSASVYRGCFNNFPSIAYNPPRDIAQRIHDLRLSYPDEEVLLMLGDVSGAFRHVPVHEEYVHMFSFMFDGYVVIDLSCGFG
ncbi:Hypothetical protein PHPALM_19503, partial [Phytophthora palmivora]